MSNNHHHHSDPLTEQISAIAKSVVAGPENVNRAIGLAMQHIGAALSASAVPYMAIQSADVVVEPQRMGESEHAVLLTTRLLRSENSSLLMINWETVADEIVFDVIAFTIDEFNLGSSKFIKLNSEIEAEVRRQVGVLLSGNPNKSGSSILNLTVVAKYFPALPQAVAAGAEVSQDTQLL